MQLYNCNVRLHGSLLHEVYKSGVTAAEVYVLRVIHGDDAVADIVHSGQQKDRTDVAERERLNMLYGAALAGNDEVKSINAIFGVAGQLPIALPGIDHSSAKTVSRGPGRPKKQVPMAPAGIDLATDDDIDVGQFEEDAA